LLNGNNWNLKVKKEISREVYRRGVLAFNLVTDGAGCSSTSVHGGTPHRQPKSVFIDIEHFDKIYPTAADSGWLTAGSI